MDVIINPGPLQGSTTVPPSKSAAHRAALCAALAVGESILSPVPDTDDMRATIGAVTALGAQARQQGERLTITGISGGNIPGKARIDCNESGSTLRFLVPIAAALGVETQFLGQGNLPNRPLTPLTDAMATHGITCAYQNNPETGEILRIAGRLSGGLYTLPGDISSQYITGLLYALPLLEEDSEITLISPLQSKGYVEMTLQALHQSGILVEELPQGWRVPGRQRYQPGERTVEADYSGAAFWLCAGALGGPVEVTGLSPDALQGDREIVDLLRRFGAEVRQDSHGVAASPGKLSGISIDAAQVPDLVPILAVIGALAQGETIIHNAGRLRIKESDRLHSITAGLQALGADIQECEDSLVIHGKEQLTGGIVDSFADHRIAMAMSIAAIRCQKPVMVLGAQCVAKSYAEFYQHHQNLGGNLNAL